MQLQTMPLRFRVWDKEEKELIYKAELAYDYLYPDVNPLCVHNFHELIEDDRYIISQDTGMVDTNGANIYEGDIVRCWDECNGVVSYDISMGQFRVKYNNGDDEPLSDAEPQVVGSIWQNPELLEEK